MDFIYIQVRKVDENREYFYLADASMKLSDFLEQFKKECSACSLRQVYLMSAGRLLDLQQSFAQNHVVYNDLLLIF